MEINRFNVSDVINKSECHPEKDYGQNFLVEPTICEKIVNALEIQPVDYVLEIGPGIGSLTHFIIQSAKKFDVVDIDLRMCNFLKVIYPTLNVVCNDIRKHDVSQYTKIIANLPYNVTTEVITYLLLNALNCEKMVLMCQSETFEHFYQTSGSEYGPTSVLIHLLGKIQRVFNVKAGCFVPAPKCTSTVFTIALNKNNSLEEVKKVYLFSKNLFLNRRKTILNNLSSLLGDKAKAEKAILAVNLKITDRPEQISPEKYLELYKFLNN